MSIKKLRIATRKSPLALWQAEHVGQLLQNHYPELQIELVSLTTTGDQFLKDPLAAIGGKGLFVKELEEALLDNRADIAVHSMKDVPNHLPTSLTIAAICKRDNPLDAFISPHSHISQLPLGSRIGTASQRRQSQLRLLRPDCILTSLRGNIHTRLHKLDLGEFDAILLAAAGLERMGMEDKIRHLMDDTMMLPACGQGAIGIECRIADDSIRSLLLPVQDTLTSNCVMAERRVNALLGGNCHVPLAVFCKPLADNQLYLRAKIVTLDAQTILYEEASGPVKNALELADTCAENLLRKGAKALLAAHPTQ